MARERMVTRTVCNGVFDVMAVNTETKEVINITVKVPSYNAINEKQVLTIINSSLPEGMVHVMHTLTDVEEVLFGMSEVDFMKYAKVLPPRTKTDD